MKETKHGLREKRRVLCILSKVLALPVDGATNTDTAW